MSGTVLAMLDPLADDGWLTHRKTENTFVLCPCITGPSHCVTNKSEVQTAELLTYGFLAFRVWFLSLLLLSKQQNVQILCLMIYYIHLWLHIHCSSNNSLYFFLNFITPLYNHWQNSVEGSCPCSFFLFSFLFFPSSSQENIIVHITTLAEKIIEDTLIQMICCCSLIM